MYHVDIADLFQQGVSLNIVYAIWAVWGGFLMHIIMMNYLSVLLKPSYEKAVETVDDVIERGLIPIYTPGGDIFKQMLANSEDPRFQQLSEVVVIAKSWDHYDEMYDKGKYNIV